MLPFHTRQINPGFSPKRSIFSVQSLQVLYSKPVLRWLPYLFGLILTLWLFGPFLFSYFERPHFPLSHPLLPVAPEILSARAQKVREAYIHAYTSYKHDAWTFDELKPVSGASDNNFNGWGVSVFDSLDTMWIMGLFDLFEEGLEVVRQTTFPVEPGKYVPFFETTIRYLGGLLSAYALSGEPILLQKADELGSGLLPAFATASGLPMFAVNPHTGETRGGWTGGVLWAEALSNQMEFKYLASLTGRAEYYEKTEKVMEIMYNANISEFPSQWDASTGKPTNTHFSVGAYADSAHEYLLKQWLLTGQSEPKTKALYLKVVESIIDTLIYVSPNRKLLYVTDANSGVPSFKFEHLSCFLPGMLALGVHTLDLPPKTKELHSWAAEGIATTCWLSYADQASGLGPDEMTMTPPSTPYTDFKWTTLLAQWEADGRPGGVPPGLLTSKPERKSGARDYSAAKSSYLLRPEALESFYILWRTTGAEVWRERGWAVFEAIEKHARLERGYASVSNVDSTPVVHLDEMPSFFLAETLKYLYLMFVDQEIIPLDKWVFNTEAHPLPVFEWSVKDRARYHIPSKMETSS